MDELPTRAGTEVDYRTELNSLEYLWLEKLQPFGDRGYNVLPVTRAERLRRIAMKEKP